MLTKLPFIQLLKMMPRMKKNYPNEFYTLLTNYGEQVQLGSKAYCFFAPDDIGYIFKKNSKNFIKTEYLVPVLGRGVATITGPLWNKQRSIVAPEFTQRSLSKYIPSLIKHISNLSDSWGSASEAKRAINSSSDFMRMTLLIAEEIMFGSDVEKSTDKLAKSLEIISDKIYSDAFSLIKLPLWVPSPNNLKVRNAKKSLDQVVFNIIEHRKNNAGNNNDVMSRLMKNYGSDSELSNKNKILEDEVMTLFTAGHETTGNTLTWVFYLLAQYPEVQDKLYNEVKHLNYQSFLECIQLDNYPYCRKIIKEVLRLYPAIPIITRVAQENDNIRGVSVPKGSTIITSPYVTHRHGKFWDHPLTFNPERFDNETHEFSYFPFGIGPRKCLGIELALFELEFITASLISQFCITLDSTHNVIPRPRITLGFDHPPFFQITRR